MTATGPLNSVVHLWAFASSGDRAARRTAMEADPEWAAYRRKIQEAGFLVSQENRLLNGTVSFLAKDGT